MPPGSSRFVGSSGESMSNSAEFPIGQDLPRLSWPMVTTHVDDSRRAPGGTVRRAGLRLGWNDAVQTPLAAFSVPDAVGWQVQ